MPATRYGRDYGASGTDRDEYGLKPLKRIENIHAVEVRSVTPVSPGMLIDIAKNFCRKKKRLPNRIIYPGAKCATSWIGTITDMGFVLVELINDKNAKEFKVE